MQANFYISELYLQYYFEKKKLNITQIYAVICDMDDAKKHSNTDRAEGITHARMKFTQRKNILD